MSSGVGYPDTYTSLRFLIPMTFTNVIHHHAQLVPGVHQVKFGSSLLEQNPLSVQRIEMTGSSWVQGQLKVVTLKEERSRDT